MAYGRLLNKMILEKGYNFKEFLDECEKRGKTIDKGNFSKIIHDKAKPPKEEISRMFANICNADERLLVLEGYVDTAPKEIKEAFISLKLKRSLFLLKAINNNFDKEVIETLEEDLRNEPIADFIISLIDFKNNGLTNMYLETETIFEDETDEYSIFLKQPIGIPVTDDGMFPIVPKNSKINILLQTEYKNGEILAIKIKEKEEMVVRYALFNDDKIVLTALNSKYDTLTFNQKDVTILGRVVRVITDI